MRNPKLNVLLKEQLNYEEVEKDLPQISAWAQKYSAEGPEAQNNFRILNNLNSFLDAIDSSFYQLDAFMSENEVEKRALQAHFRRVANFLNNLRQSAFTVNAEGIIKGPVSKYSDIIFGESIVGKKIFEILYKNIPRDSEEFALLNTAFIMVYGEDENQWENMHEQFPQRIRSSLGGKEKILKVDTSPMWNEEGLLDSLLFVIEDITELELLAEKVKAEKDKGNRKLLIMQEMMSCASEDAEDFFAKVDEFIQQINAVFRKTSWEKEDINLIFRNLHTIKGNARSYNLSFLSATTHKVETSFVEIQDIHFDLPFFEKKSMPILVEQVNEYREVMNKIYHSEQDGVTLPSKSKKQIKALRSFMRENEGKLPSDVFSVLNNMMNQILDESCLNPIKKLVEKTVKVTSADCGKNVDFDVQGIDFIVPDMVLSLIKDSIVHIIRNAIGHGIETKDIRKLSGKDLIGHIIVNVVPTEDQLKVQIADDGRGIDTNRLKKKAIDLKFMKAADAEKATKEQLIELLFMPGFSTKDQVTETSGRGVGLDVARENIEKAGGLLKVETILNVGTTFTLILPLKGGIELIAPIAA